MNNTIDIIGALLSLISSYFYIKERSVAWLISLSAIPFDVMMDIGVGVYGDLIMQFIYFILLIYGWYSWRNGAKVEEVLPMLRISPKQLCLFATSSILLFSGLWFTLAYYTDSEVAILDATVTGLSMVAQWLLCKKIVESWLLWIIVDVLYAALFIYKQMPCHGFLALFDAGICVVGYLYWIREHRKTGEIPASA